MNVERFVIEELGGLNTNFVEGLGKQPSVLKNAAFTRLGGYEFWGELETVFDFGGVFVPRLIDDTGFGVYGDNRFTTGSGSLTLPFIPNFMAPATSVNTPTAMRYKATGAGWAYAPQTGLTLTSGDIDAIITGDLEKDSTYELTWVNYVQSDHGRIAYASGSIDVSLSGNDTGFDVNFPIGPGKQLYLRSILVLPAPVKGEIVAHPDARYPYPDGPFTSSNSTAATRRLRVQSKTQIVASSHVYIRLADPPRTVRHQARFYTANPRLLRDPEILQPWLTGPGAEDGETKFGMESATSTGRPSRVYYTDLGWVNRTRTFNFFDVPFAASGSIMALASTPAGLLIFGENEVFLFRGDPEAGPSLVPFAGTFGIDPHIRPASMGGVVCSIYGGEAYLISLGMGDVDFGSGVQNISREVFDRNDPLIQVVADHPRNVFLFRTLGRRVLRYHAATQKWSEDPFSGSGTGLLMLIPNAGVDSFNPSPFYTLPNANPTTLYTTKRIGAGTMTFGWRDLDLGDKRAGKLWRSVEVYTNEEYDGQPLLTWRVGENTGVVAGRNKGKGIWVFVLPTGQTGPLADLVFTFPGMDSTDTIEPPVVVSFVPRGRARTRYPAYQPPL